MELKEINLAPRQASTIERREDVNLEVRFKKINASLPIISSPMDTIGGLEMCEALSKKKILSTLHRFAPTEERLNKFVELKSKGLHEYVFVSVGLEEFSFVDSLYELGNKNFLIDTANGFNYRVVPIVKYIKEKSQTILICGNVATREGFLFLANLGVDAIRVGIGTGSMCTTSIMTGVGLSLPDSVSEAVLAKIKLKKGNKESPLIIADGGISTPGEIAKILYWGADLVMIGRMLAGTAEAEGSILKYQDKLYKVYRGLASFAVQAKTNNSPYYIEGDETIVEYKGSVKKVVDQIRAGLQSSLSYMNAKNIQELKNQRILLA
jgi:IMP dehydrogenase